MRTRTLPVVVLALLLTLPTLASAQIGVAGRVGFIEGLGADLGIAVGTSLHIRGGAGIQPVNPSVTLSDIDFEVNLPSSFMHAGIEFFPSGGGFRIGGGVLYKPDDVTISGTFNESQEIGGTTYTPAQIGTISGTATAEKTMAPYAMIGFGKIASSGIGLFLDLGAAFVGESVLEVTSNGQFSGNAQFQQDLQEEETAWEEDLNKFKIWPMINIGLRIGFGG